MNSLAAELQNGRSKCMRKKAGGKKFLRNLFHTMLAKLKFPGKEAQMKFFFFKNLLNNSHILKTQITLFSVIFCMCLGTFPMFLCWRTILPEADGRWYALIFSQMDRVWWIPLARLMLFTVHAYYAPAGHLHFCNKKIAKYRLKRIWSQVEGYLRWPLAQWRYLFSSHH